MATSLPLFGAIEAGGTKFLCALGSGPDGLRAQTRIPTTSPTETLGRVISFFQQAQPEHGLLAAIGLACFGPLDPDPHSPTFGHILTTPKPGWANVNVVGILQEALPSPLAFDTDVNGAALAEWRWGAAQGLDVVLYLTIGTGIGGGILVNGKPVHGFLHPEMGHILVPHDWRHDPFPGICPFHGDCLEGLASGPAIEKRWGQKAEMLPPAHPAWELEAHYLAHALANYVCTLSPEKIILGGGVTHQKHLFPRLRQKVQQLIQGYLPHLPEMNTYLVPPKLGNQAGVLGALALAESSLNVRP